MATPAFAGEDLELELLDPGSRELVRLFKHAGGEWDPTPEIYRNERVDPPSGAKHRFAVLYVADTLEGVATECRVLHADVNDRWTWNTKLAADYCVARYRFDRAALFVRLDGSNERALGLQARQRGFGGGKLPFQEVSLALFERFGKVVHGMSWASFHRHKPARVFALWHDHKATIDLSVNNGPSFPRLIEDPQWQQFLLDNPDVTALDPAAP